MAASGSLAPESGAGGFREGWEPIVFAQPAPDSAFYIERIAPLAARFFRP